MTIAKWVKQSSVNELENLLIIHEMVLIKTDSLKIEGREEAMLSKESKGKPQGKSKSRCDKGGSKDSGDSYQCQVRMARRHIIKRHVITLGSPLCM